MTGMPQWPVTSARGRCRVRWMTTHRPSSCACPARAPARATAGSCTTARPSSRRPVRRAGRPAARPPSRGCAARRVDSPPRRCRDEERSACACRPGCRSLAPPDRPAPVANEPRPRAGDSRSRPIQLAWSKLSGYSGANSLHPPILPPLASPLTPRCNKTAPNTPSPTQPQLTDLRAHRCGDDRDSVRPAPYPPGFHGPRAARRIRRRRPAPSARGVDGLHGRQPGRLARDGRRGAGRRRRSRPSSRRCRRTSCRGWRRTWPRSRSCRSAT